MTVNLSSFPTNATLTPTDATAQGWPHRYVVLSVLSTLFFSIIIAIGLFGNSLILATLARFREMRTPCNLLIGNICAADLAVCVIAAPLRIIEIYRGWIFGDVMCYILAPLQDVFNVVSVFSQTLIALERHRAIVAPFKSKNTLNGVKKAVFVIWIVSYLTAGVPMLIFIKNTLYNNGYYYCFPLFPSNGYRVTYEVYLVILFIAFPLVIQCAAYFSVIRALKAKNELQLPSSLQKNILLLRIRQKKRLIRMLIVLMLAFQVCYLPRGVILLMQEFSAEITSRPEFGYVEHVTLAMYYFKHITNPFLLWAMSKDYRAGCLAVCLHWEFYLLRRKCRSRYNRLDSNVERCHKLPKPTQSPGIIQ